MNNNNKKEYLSGFDSSGNQIDIELLDGGKLGKPIIRKTDALKSNANGKNILTKEYRKSREALSGDPTMLELKHRSSGILSASSSSSPFIASLGSNASAADLLERQLAVLNSLSDRSERESKSQLLRNYKR